MVLTILEKVWTGMWWLTAQVCQACAHLDSSQSVEIDHVV